MALIGDTEYILHSLRLAHLRASNDIHSSRIISFSPNTLTTNAYVRTAGQADLDIWPEIAAGLDSPPLEVDKYLEESGSEGLSEREDEVHTGMMRRRQGRRAETLDGHAGGPSHNDEAEVRDPNVGLKYSQTIGRQSRFTPGVKVDGYKAGSARNKGSLSQGEDSSTPLARYKQQSYSTVEANISASSTPGAGGIRTGRDRMRASTIDDASSATPGRNNRSHLEPNSYASSGGRTPTVRALTGLPPGSLLSTAPKRQNRPRADSAPMVVVTSPATSLSGLVGRDAALRSPASPLREDSFDTPTAKGKLPKQLIKSRRITSMVGTSPIDAAFSPAAISSVLGQSYLKGPPAGLGGANEVPPPGADPHAARMQAQYGSILEQAMMSGSLVTGFTDRSTAVSSSGMGSYGNGFSEIDEEDEDGQNSDEDQSEDRMHRGNPHHRMGAKSILTGIELAPEISLGSMDGFGQGSRASESTSTSMDGSGTYERYGGGDSRRTSVMVPAPKMTFEKRKRIPPNPSITADKPSALSLLLQPVSANPEESLGDANRNPFASYVSAAPAEGSTLATLSPSMYFPLSKAPTKALKITVRKEITVEELIGWALHEYVEQGRGPDLREGHGNGPNAALEEDVWLSTAGWALRIVEDDGEVDEDFPALDRDGQLSKFSFDAFAIVEASSAQIKQNLAKQPLPAIRRSGTSTPYAQPGGRGAAAGSVTTPEALPGDGNSFDTGSRFSPTGRQNTYTGSYMTGFPGLSTSTTSAMMGGVMVMLKVRVVAAADVHFSTTINVPSEMYFADIIELLIYKKSLKPSNSGEWVLALGDLSMVLPLDRTVESLMGTVNLALVRKSWAQSHGLAVNTTAERLGGDPNTSIFKRSSDAPKQKLNERLDSASTYKKFVVQRKMPIGRHERILAIDGDYIHIMPTDNKAFFDSMKTSSFHVTSIITCKQSSRSPINLKIVVWRDGAEKRYDFEAENTRQAAEVIAAIKALMKLYTTERANTIPSPSSRPTAHRSRLRRH